MEKKRATSLRLSSEGKRLLKALAEQYGITQAAALEIAIREQAKREQVK
jgi:predicted transcriptional regulator